jgi:AbrB family looped-hinge helix DNA binding protein
MVASGAAGFAGCAVLFLLLLYRYTRGKIMAPTATLSSKYQISVPKAIRDDLHWEAGQEFVFIPKGKGVLLMPVPDLKQLAGIARGANTENYRDRQDRF